MILHFPCNPGRLIVSWQAAFNIFALVVGALLPIMLVVAVFFFQ